MKKRLVNNASMKSEKNGGFRLNPPHDLGFYAFVILITGVGCWLIMMPFSTRVTQSTMKRFHLQSKSYTAWFLQFPIPSMYNFANRYQVDRYPPGLIAPLFEENQPRHINHFPARCFTFADARHDLFEDGSDRWIMIESKYRGRELVSRYHLRKQPSEQTTDSKLSHYEVIRTSVEH